VEVLICMVDCTPTLIFVAGLPALLLQMYHLNYIILRQQLGALAMLNCARPTYAMFG
jgi:hypothetical protein